jgi:heterodisulfide reductase subunit A2
MTCAISIAAQGFDVHLIEKSKELGGMARRIHKTIEGMDVVAHLEDLKRKVYQNSRIYVSHDATIQDVSGYIGNFTTTVKSEHGVHQITHGAAVIAIGAEVYHPTEYLYGQNERVITHVELGEMIVRGDETLQNADRVVMIQCVGCRNEDRNYCSRVCCSHSIKNALQLKALNPDIDIDIIFRDVRTYGFREDFYRQASSMGVRFIRYSPETPPEVKAGTDEAGKPVIKVSLTDPVLGYGLELDADILALAAAVVPAASTSEIAGLFKVTLSPDGFFKEAHVKLRPVEFSTDGVFLCGTAHYPKHIQESINQAYGAAGRVVTLLSRDTVVASGAICTVTEKRCMGCGACIEVCAYGAIEMQKSRRSDKAQVNPVLCKGDGLCNAVCPTGAIILKHFTDEVMLSQINALNPLFEMAEPRRHALAIPA